MKVLAVFLVALLVLSVPVLATEALSISWATADETVRPGGQTTIDLTLGNPSLTGAIQYVRLSIVAGPHLTVSPDFVDIASLGTLSVQHTAVDVKVSPTAVSTTSYVTVKATYSVSSLGGQETTIKIPIKIVREPIFQILNVNLSNVAEPGISTKMSFDLYNSGQGSAKNMFVSIGQNSTVFSSIGSGETYVSNLGPSEIRRLEFPISIKSNTVPGVYSIPVTFKYYDETNSQQVTSQKSIGLEVNGKAQFVITVDELSNFYIGRQGKASISISNAGTGGADFLILNASSPYGNKELYIGSLDSDDTETVDITQDLSRASGKYMLDLNLMWKDKFGNSYNETRQMELKPQYAPIGGTTIGLIVLVIAAIVGYRFYKKKKK